MNKNSNFVRGFSLIETLIAFMLVGIMGGAVVYILAQVVSVTKSADLKGQATSYANQGIEVVRDYYQSKRWLSLAGKDTAGGGGASDGPTCYNNSNVSTWSTGVICMTTLDTANLARYESLLGGLFYRQYAIDTSTVAPGKVAVTVYVFWLEKGRAVPAAKVSAAFYNY